MIAQFGSCEVDFDKVEIRRNGETIKVQPQVFTVIEYLVRNHERVVPKEELLDNIWGDRFVSESALTSRIKSARRALGDNGVDQAVIRTAVGRGYRFVAELQLHQEPQPARPSNGYRPDVQPLLDRPTALGAPTGRDEWPMLGRRDELAVVKRCAEDPSVPGVLISGPKGIGAVRFAETCRAIAASLGHPTARIVGLASAAALPLAAVAHLLPDDVLTTDQPDQGLALAAIMDRARRSIEALASRRFIFLVENAEHLDPMTATLLSSVMLNGAAFGLVVRSPLMEADRYSDSHVQASVTPVTIELPRLDEMTVDILLHRVLGGPISAPALREIIAASDGRPGLIRDVVETSRRTGALMCEHGVWSLAGDLSSSTRRTWDSSSLSESALRGAEILSLVRLSEAQAVELIGDHALDELDALHLLAVDPTASGYTVTLSDPLLAIAILEQVGSLRMRRLQTELAERLLTPSATPELIASILAWGDVAARPDDALLLTSAQSAMVDGNTAAASALISHLEDRSNPQVQLIEAEVALRQSQWAQAEALFESLDVDQLDDPSTTHVLRRQAGIQFYSRSRFEYAIRWLEREAAQRGGQPGRALRARRLGMLAHLGRASETIKAASELGGEQGLTAIEVTLSVAAAKLLEGRSRAAIASVEEVDPFIRALPPASAHEPLDAAVTVRCSALLHIGRIDDAATLARQHLPLGKRTPLGYLPSLAGLIELAAGRPKAAREFVRQATQSSHREAFPHYRSIADAVFASTDLALGRVDSARRGLERARRALPSVAGQLQWLLAIRIARLAHGLGEAERAEPLLELAADAAASGAAIREAHLLCTASSIDHTGKVGKQVVDRVDELVRGFDGNLWPVRAREIHAITSGEGLASVAAEYRRLGYHGLVTSN